VLDENEALAVYQGQTIPVPNNPPVASDDSVTIDEDTSVSVTLFASDLDNDPLTYSVVSGSSNGVLSGTEPNMTYTPNPDYNGSDSFTFRANDGSLDSNIATVSLTIDPVNDAPTISGTPDTTVNDYQPYTFTPNAGDVDTGDVLTFDITNQPPWTTFDVDTGVLDGTPAYTDVGTYPDIIITATDSSFESASLPAFDLEVLEDPNRDLDEDGYVNSADCDDSDPVMNPGEEEMTYNGKDDDCDPATLDVPPETNNSPYGDMDGDEDVDLNDRVLILGALRACSGDANYDDAADMDGDGCVTFIDYREWFKAYKAYMNP